MSNMPRTDKRQVGLRLSLELCFKVRAAFARPDDCHESDAFIRALEEGTRDVTLPKKAYEEIAEQIRMNELRRRNMLIKRRHGTCRKS